MRRKQEANQNIRELDKYQKNKNQPLNKKSYSQFAQNIKDKQLYELCRNLSHQNRLLKKENSQLKKFIESEEKDIMNRDSFASQIEIKNYREANYESYKKKTMQLISSVKLLHKLYNQRNSLKKEEEVFDNFMSKLKNGKSNIVIQLVRLFDQKIKETDSVEWNIDEIERQSSKYQNQLLRNHIKKMNNILLGCIYQLKRDVIQVREDMRINQENIDRQIRYYCQKYINFPQKQYARPQKQSKCNNDSVVQENKIKPVSLISKNKPKHSQNKVKSKIRDENTVPVRISAQKPNKSIAKPLQPRTIVPNIVQKLSQSLAQVKSLNNYTVSVFNKRQTKPPKPLSQSKKQEKTIMDQLRSSNNTGKSAATPKSRVSASKSHFKESEADYNFNFEGTPVWPSQNTSGRKYYR